MKTMPFFFLGVNGPILCSSPEMCQMSGKVYQIKPKLDQPPGKCEMRLLMEACVING